MDALLEATRENIESKALDRATEFYLRMRGENATVPNGALEALTATVKRQRNVTPEEIAEILDTDEIQVLAPTE